MMPCPTCGASDVRGPFEEAAELTALRSEVSRLTVENGKLRDERDGQLKDAFVAGCCAVLTWTGSGMAQDDLDEAGYDYVAGLRALIDKTKEPTS